MCAISFFEKCSTASALHSSLHLHEDYGARIISLIAAQPCESPAIVPLGPINILNHFPARPWTVNYLSVVNNIESTLCAVECVYGAGLALGAGFLFADGCLQIAALFPVSP